MRILQVSISDINGGAEKLALTLHNEYLKRGFSSTLLVGWKRSESDGVIGLDKPKYSFNWAVNAVNRKLERVTGIQAMGFPNFATWWTKNKANYDIVHLHNVHSGYFDISIMPTIADTHPIVQTLHDCWPFTGHCAHPFDCENWRKGCGKCPCLDTYPKVDRDFTRFNLARRVKSYELAKPMLTCPSKWMMRMLEASCLNRLPHTYISNGVESPVLPYRVKSELRKELKLPLDSKIALFVANTGLRHVEFKDPKLLYKILRILLKRNPAKTILLLSVGGVAQEVPEDLRTHIMQRPYQTGGMDIYYQAADVLLYPTKADNCPLVILESMANGLPVVSSDVGGSSELLGSGKAGYAISPGDPSAFADAVQGIISLNDSGFALSCRAHFDARFTLSKMVDGYIDMYKALKAAKRN